MRVTTQLLGPICWASSIQYYVIQLVSAGAWNQAGFSWLHNTISDLGNTVCGGYGSRFVCSPLSSLMNGSFVLLAITMVVGSLALGRQYAHNRVQWAGFICMVVSGFGTLLVGLFPENSISAAHIAGATLVFLTGNVSMVVLGWKIRAFPLPLQTYAVVSGLVGIAALLLFINHIYVGLSIGGMERIVAYPQSIFMIVCGVFLLMKQFSARTSTV